MFGLLLEPIVLQSMFVSGGTILSALILGGAAFFGYGRQKNADRTYDLVKLKQEEYELYLRAFQESSLWKGVNDELWEQAQNAYHNAQNYMLLHASEDVIKAVNAAHRYYVDSEVVDWREFKRLYAEMIIAMRADGYTPSTLSIQEMADNIPWTMGSEPEDRKALKQQTPEFE